MAESQTSEPTATNPQAETSPASPEKKQKPWPVIGLVTLLILSLGTTAYFAYENHQLKQQIKQKPPTPLSEVTKQPENSTPRPSESESSTLGTYLNDDIGISFQYPEKFEAPEVRYDDSALRPGFNEKWDSGKAIYVSFPNRNMHLSVYTDDFNAWQWTKPKRTCPQDYFVERNGHNGSFSRQCKSVKLESGQHVMANIFDEIECSPLFRSCIYISNPNSQYKNINFCLNFLDEKYLEEYSCIDDQKASEAYKLVEILSENIMRKTNLSSEDTSSLDHLIEMASSIKFY